MSQPISEVTVIKGQKDSNNNNIYSFNLTPVGKDKIKILKNKTGFKEPSDLLLILHGTAYAVSVLHGLFVYFLNPIKMITTKTRSVNGVVTERIVKPIYLFSQKHQLLSAVVTTVMTIFFLAHAYFYYSRPPFAPINAINELCKKALKDEKAYAIFHSDPTYYFFKKNAQCINLAFSELTSFLDERPSTPPTSLETILKS